MTRIARMTWGMCTASRVRHTDVVPVVEIVEVARIVRIGEDVEPLNGIPAMVAPIESKDGLVVEAAGIRDIVSKILGSNNKASNVYATMAALKELAKKEQRKK